MVIYTKRGDKGETGMFSDDPFKQIRVSKDSVKTEALGAIDELNSFLGMVRSEIERRDKQSLANEYIGREKEKYIRKVQENLLTIGSITAGSKLRFSKAQTKKLEELIDELEGKLPVLKNFVIPCGTLTAAQFQYARVLARRAERRVVTLSKIEKVKPEILEYLNRLSDMLFMAAREENFRYGVEEEIWKGKK